MRAGCAGAACRAGRALIGRIGQWTRGGGGGGRVRAAGSAGRAREWCAGAAHLSGSPAPSAARPPLLPRSGFEGRRISFAPRALPAAKQFVFQFLTQFRVTF